MNERIRELAEQAYQEQDPELLTNASRTFEHGIWLSGYSKKFAELIVRECARVADDSNQMKNRPVGVSAGDVVLKNFGVK